MSAEEWCVSRDGEAFYGSFASRDEAVANANDELSFDKGERVYVGRRVDFVPEVSGYWVSEQLLDHASGNIPSDFVDGWLDLTGDEERSLGEHVTKGIHAWLRDNGHWPTFFSVEGIEQHKYPGDPDAVPNAVGAQ